MERSTSPGRGFAGLSPLEHQRRDALLRKITQFETRGAILPIDARTLRNQLHDSTSGQWKAVEMRLQQLALHWNPYQDGKDCARAKKTKKLNFYELLALENDGNVNAKDIKRQFRKLALLLHPDKMGMNRKRERRVEEVDEDTAGLDAVCTATIGLRDAE
ncbi:unnamed protein product [Peronospora destructor]|uniref:J domain-containing protein n=1 Tax=Peronospora destructor TaxID=86335 RepID=A0AAV0V1W2_9STRA|nr:unnamed protein product [Peronospora destructor]